uniref:FACT complex subunit n=1 Tax=Caenorhabditis tropicalis TaxID=1561998 RepID=A0A1I7TTK9_9PELO
MADKRIDRDTFFQRAERLYELWEKEESLSSVNSLAVTVGETENSYTKSSAVYSWLFGNEMKDTVILFLKNHIYILGTSRKVDQVSSVLSDQYNGRVPPVSTMTRNKNDHDAENFETLIGYMTDAGENAGVFIKDKFDSDFIKDWQDALKKSGITQVDVSLFFAHLFSIKDEKEIELLRKSATATSNTWSAAKTKYVEIIDQEKRVRHSVLSKDFVNFMKDPKIQDSLTRYDIDTSYEPIVMSGGNYSFKWNHESSESHVNSQFGSIITSFGARLSNYCTNLTRTMLVFPSSELEAAYEAVLAAELAVIAALKPGVKLNEVYKVGVNTLAEKSPKLVENLNKKELGFATGIEFRESRLSISAKCEETVQAGMAFIVYIGVDNIPNKKKGEKGKPAAIAISDTVLVKEEGENEVLTEKAKSRLKSNLIRFKDQENEEAETDKDKKKLLGRGQRSVVLNDQTRNKTTNEELRKEHQKELGKRLNVEARARLSKQDGGTDEKKVKKSNVSYKNEERFPQDADIHKMLIYVDRKYDSVIIPIFGIPVPFHISMIKNCSQSVEGDFTYLRINFATPGSQLGKDNGQFPHPLAHYMKELTFRASNSKSHHSDSSPPSNNLSTAFRLIKEMQKRFRTEEAEEREKDGAVKQDKLILSQNKLNPKLKDLLIRPNIIQKRITGSLEAHTNGFRYTSLRGDRIDVLYNNIKHAFFQPCDNEMIILLHFHLKNPVMWGKKNTRMFNSIQKLEKLLLT